MHSSVPRFLSRYGPAIGVKVLWGCTTDGAAPAGWAAPVEVAPAGVAVPTTARAAAAAIAKVFHIRMSPQLGELQER
jgi:hypothetical protein